jgi:hypothetical protein
MSPVGDGDVNGGGATARAVFAAFVELGLEMVKHQGFILFLLFRCPLYNKKNTLRKRSKKLN